MTAGHSPKNVVAEVVIERALEMSSRFHRFESFASRCLRGSKAFPFLGSAARVHYHQLSLSTTVWSEIAPSEIKSRLGFT